MVLCNDVAATSAMTWQVGPTCHVVSKWLPRKWQLANEKPPRGGDADIADC
ncbi:hypothetical protein Tco_1442722, partial [Tanacetum coccineum]